ncbi:PAQR family membrane homeostasis protein TrhA [Isoptericola nanjingensis]|uniref:PAQR family membrane homeostasis protein TrhA n=1 Tax=Isoptericola TaxID=254250 RepID=UPI0035F0E936
MAAAAQPNGHRADRLDVDDVKEVAREAKGVMGDAVQTVSAAAAGKAALLKPHLRGWIHAVTTPLALAAAIVLVVLADTTADKVACAVFGVTAVMLFGTSAVYHLGTGTWSPRTAAVLRRLDHANIFLIIAGTYTPLAVMLLPRGTATVLLAVVWSGAILGLVGRVLWMSAPRWLYVPVYVALGCVAVGYIPQFAAAGGAAVAWLVASGGIAYILGAVVYGTKFPDPSPRWFGFHEIFHALTVVGFTCHTVAIYLAAL